MDEIWLAVRWYLAMQVFAIAALPVCLRLFRRLPDRGYGLSKAVGLLLSGWLFWMLGTAGVVQNSALGVLFTAAIVAAFSWLPVGRRTAEVPTPPWRLALTVELIFAISFAVWALVRADMPRIDPSGGEKWMEITFLQGILRSETFPPNDPWLSGYSISYYYFGYLITAMIAQLAAVPGSIAFNLGVAAIFALTCTGAFGLAYDLAAVERGSKGGGDEAGRRRRSAGVVGRAIAAGLLAVLLVAVMGNLEALLEVLHASGIGSAEFWAWMDVSWIDGPPPAVDGGLQAPTRFFWWWQASRVVVDYSVTGQEQLVINEFPAFSFVLGDLHPHLLSLPFVLLAIGLALNVLVRSRVTPRLWEIQPFGRTIPFPLTGWELLFCALALGGLGFLNTWDFPIYLGLYMCAYLIGQLPFPREEWLDVALRVGLLAIALVLAGVILYLPFWAGFQSQAGGVLPNLSSGTRFNQFFVVFGPLAVLASALVVHELGSAGLSLWDTVGRALALVGILAVACAVIIGVVLLLVSIGKIAPEGPFYYVDLWLGGEPIPGADSDLEGWALPIRVIQRHIAAVRAPEALQFAGLLSVVSSLLAAPIWVVLGMATLAVGGATAIIRGSGDAGAVQGAEGEVNVSGRSFLLLLVALGAALVFIVEFVYLQDIYGDRMNTVFKFYFQVWVMWAIVGACTLVRLIGFSSCAAEPRRRLCLVAVSAVSVFLILAGLLYPFLAIPKRQEEHGRPGTLDGAAHLAIEHPDDYAAIDWLNQYVDGAPVILETPGDGYAAWTYVGRVSAHTGLPTLLGWGDHEFQWRGSYEVPGEREPDIETLYTSEDLAEVEALLDKYEIEYVYVGPTERGRYPVAGLDKFAQMMGVLYEVGNVTIYGR